MSAYMFSIALNVIALVHFRLYKLLDFSHSNFDAKSSFLVIHSQFDLYL